MPDITELELLQNFIILMWRVVMPDGAQLPSASKHEVVSYIVSTLPEHVMGLHRLLNQQKQFRNDKEKAELALARFQSNIPELGDLTFREQLRSQILIESINMIESVKNKLELLSKICDGEAKCIVDQAIYEITSGGLTQ